MLVHLPDALERTRNEFALWPRVDYVAPDLRRWWRAQRGWRGARIRERDCVIDCPHAFVAAAGELARAHDDPYAVARMMPQLPGAAALQRQVEETLEGGIGFCVLKGFQPSGDDQLDRTLLLGVSGLFGQPVSQTPSANAVARVEDLTGSLSDPSVRGHNTSAELAFHSDRADRIVLYCIRPARAGGESAVVSALHARDAMAAASPDRLELLERPLPQDRRGDHAPGEPPYCELPIFSQMDGVPVARYLRRFIHDSQRHAEAPRLSPSVIDALDCLDAALAADGASHRMRLQAGDIQILNNHVVFHARSAFQDDRTSPRLLLRVWLAHRSSRPLPACFRVLFGPVEAGAYRGGVWPRAAGSVAHTAESGMARS